MKRAALAACALLAAMLPTNAWCDNSRNSTVWARYLDHYIRHSFIPDIAKSKYGQKKHKNYESRINEIIYVTEQRSKGLPPRCIKPTRIAYSEQLESKYHIHLCSNNFVFISDVIQVYADFAKYKDKFLSEKNVFEYLAYKGDIYVRRSAHMWEKDTKFDMGCNFPAFIFTGAENIPREACGQLTPEQRSKFQQWMKANNNLVDNDKMATLDKIQAIAKANGHTQSTYKNNLIVGISEAIANIVVAHEIGHIMNGDLEISLDEECEIIKGEISADNFAKKIIIDTKYSDKQSIAMESMFLAIYFVIVSNQTSRITGADKLADTRIYHVLPTISSAFKSKEYRALPGLPSSPLLSGRNMEGILAGALADAPRHCGL